MNETGQPRPLPRTVTPVAGEYHLDYVRRLADANHLEFAELADTLHDPAAFTVRGPNGWEQHEKEWLAVPASQPLARIARLWWPGPRYYLRDIEGFHQMLRPACRRCTARYGITGPAACHRTRPSAAATGSGPAPPPAATTANSTAARSPRSSAPGGATSP